MLGDDYTLPAIAGVSIRWVTALVLNSCQHDNGNGNGNGNGCRQSQT